MAVVTGTRNFVRLFGSTIALAIGGALINNALRSTLAALALAPSLAKTLLDDPTAVNDPVVSDALTPAQRSAIVDGYLRGFRSVFYMTVACQLVAFLAAVLLIDQHDLNRDDDRAQKDRSRAMIQERKARRREGEADADADLEAANTEVEKEKEGAEDVALGVGECGDEKRR